MFPSVFVGSLWFSSVPVAKSTSAGTLGDVPRYFWHREWLRA